MTPEQREELLDKVADLIGEHCNAFVFIAEVECSEEIGADSMICT